MTETAYAHRPVLLEETLAVLAVQPDGYYVDATFGRGGHSRAILAQLGPHGRLLGVDQDPAAVAEGQALAAADPRFEVVHARFDQLRALLEARDWAGRVQGILLDLGVSSPQLDDAERGFSFMRDGPLDMRMDPSGGEPASAWLARAGEVEIANVLFRYGEERQSRRIARAILNARVETPLETTRQLAQLIATACPSHDPHKHPATRSFQAIRIFLNRELEVLEEVLPQTLEVLAPGGRLAVISFHSLEDRLVKRYIREQAKGDPFPPGMPVTADQLQPRLRPLGKDIRAGDAELDTNPRARSAVLRGAQKL